MKKTLVLGASTKSERYSNMAVKALLKHGHEVIAVGRDAGEIDGLDIQRDFPADQVFDTVTLYLNPTHQKEYYQSVLALKPKRIIFSPGAENREFEKLAQAKGIQTEEACTLVLLSTNQY
jgi:predicted CoA-binding protein